uniref:Uncharacterized protein n=1 Tax=Sipha flava TaxID=143950 RepID=A0A2S2R7K5_9HEMI
MFSAITDIRTRPVTQRSICRRQFYVLKSIRLSGQLTLMTIEPPPPATALTVASSHCYNSTPVTLGRAALRTHHAVISDASTSTNRPSVFMGATGAQILGVLKSVKTKLIGISL